MKLVGKNMLLVPQAEEFMEKYREEIAHEFGIFHSTAQFDQATTMTESLLKKKNKEDDC